VYIEMSSWTLKVLSFRSIQIAKHFYFGPGGNCGGFWLYALKRILSRLLSETIGKNILSGLVLKGKNERDIEITHLEGNPVSYSDIIFVSSGLFFCLYF
jgi:hypothetical protein